MSYKIVFFDIDGTLVNDEKVIPQDTIEAIAQLKESGIEPVIATGRAPYFIKLLADQLGIDSYVSLNGAYVVYKGEPIYKREIGKSSLEALVARAAEHNHGLVFEGEDWFYANQEEHPFIINSVGSLRVEQPGYNPDFWKTDGVYQVFLHCDASEEHFYYEVDPELRLIRWHPYALDVLPTNGSKAQGIDVLLKKLGLSPAEAVAFGDGLNDKEMLEVVGLGIAMGNSHPELLPYADYVTTSVDEQGIRNGLVKAGLI